MMQHSLLDWTPPVIEGPRDGKTFDAPRDLSRLNAQMRDVFLVMHDGNWRTLTQISAATFHPEASVSARLRDLRKPKFGAFTVERKRIGKGLFTYRLVI